MQLDNLVYIFKYDINLVFNKIYQTRKQVVYRNDKLIETMVENIENKRLHYLLEDKERKIEVDMIFNEELGETIIDITCSVKLRNIVKDLFSYLSINIKKDFDEYMEKIKGELDEV